MTNPFDDLDAQYQVLVNQEGQHTLWPDFAKVPAGWQVVHGPGDRQACIDYVESHWTDLRPKSLIAAMKADATTRREP
jgi:MbtH protein